MTDVDTSSNTPADSAEPMISPAEELPGIVRELADMIGLDAVYQLMEAKLFGCEWRVSRTRHSDWYREWSDVIGEEKADKIMRTWGGCELYFPRCSAAYLRIRNKKIIARYDELLSQGMTTRSLRRMLSREFGISDSTVKKIANNPG